MRKQWLAGRESEGAEEPRQYVGFAVPLAVKGQLEEAARQSGRSLAQECVSRLEQMFLIDQRSGQPD